ncbi:MAG TPA: hypothetical protein VG890_15415 [Puia sp.]|nr:hypothetical protein [Puia sp.]
MVFISECFNVDFYIGGNQRELSAAGAYEHDVLRKKYNLRQLKCIYQ